MAIVNPGFNSPAGSRKAVPPGQSIVDNWPVLTYGPTPEIDISKWALEISGAVNKPVTLDWQAFNELPTIQLKTDIHCVTRWSRLGMEWRGVSLDTLIEQAGGLKEGARHLIGKCYGGYTTNVPIVDIAGGKSMIATHADGEKLSPEHGGPARLFVPHLYLWKSAKYINQLVFTQDDEPGFWERNGYHNYGDPWREQRYDGDA